MKIFIVGDTGLLGKNLVKFFIKKRIKVLLNSKNNSNYKTDFTKKTDVIKLLNQVKPDIIINLAALTNVDECEKYKSKARKLNIEIPKNISRWSESNQNTFIIHISTDQVYSGNGPHKENSFKIINYYSKTKKKGEDCFLKHNTTILRTNFFGATLSKKKSFTDWIYCSVKTRKKIYLFNNIKFNPLSINTLCKYLLIVIKKKIPGTYNLGSKYGFSKANFALKFLKELNINKFEYEIINFKQNFVAKRSLDMRMNVNKFEKTFKVKLPKCNDEIKKEVKAYKLFYNLR